MGEQTAGAVENTDREIWRETEGDFYSPSVHVTARGGIGIDVGGHVFVKSLRDWHFLAMREFIRTLPPIAPAPRDPTRWERFQEWFGLGRK